MFDREQLNHIQNQVATLRGDVTALRKDVANILRYCSYLPLIHAKEFSIMAAIDDLKQAAADLSAAVDAENAVLKGIEDKLAAAIAAGNQDPAIAAVVADLQASRQRSADATAAANAILNPPTT